MFSVFEPHWQVGACLLPGIILAALSKCLGDSLLQGMYLLFKECWGSTFYFKGIKGKDIVRVKCLRPSFVAPLGMRAASADAKGSM